MPSRSGFSRVLTLLLLFPAFVFAANKATYIRPIMQSLPAAGVTQVVLQNLVGPISIQTSDSPTIDLEILIHAGGADETFARTLAQQLNFQVERIGGQLRIIGVYPLDRFRDYGYPKMKSVFGIHGTDSNEYDGQKVFIRNVSSKKAVELWAEVRLKLPPTLALVVRNTYGDVDIQGGSGPAASGSLDGFTDVGDFTLYRPRWAQIKLQSDYGKVEFTDGLGSGQDIHVNTDVGGTYLDLPPDASGKIIAHKDLGFLHNDVSNARFTKDSDGDSVLQLGNGQGPTVHIDMSVGSLHLRKVGGA